MSRSGSIATEGATLSSVHTQSLVVPDRSIFAARVNAVVAYVDRRFNGPAGSSQLRLAACTKTPGPGKIGCPSTETCKTGISPRILCGVDSYLGTHPTAATPGTVTIGWTHLDSGQETGRTPGSRPARCLFSGPAGDWQGLVGVRSGHTPPEADLSNWSR